MAKRGYSQSDTRTRRASVIHPLGSDDCARHVACDVVIHRAPLAMVEYGLRAGSFNGAIALMTRAEIKRRMKGFDRRICQHGGWAHLEGEVWS